MRCDTLLVHNMESTMNKRAESASTVIHKKFQLFIAALIVVLLPLSMSAQSASGDASNEGNTRTILGSEVIITGTRVSIPLKDLAAATSVLDRRTIEKAPKGISIGEMLDLVPGVRVETQYDSEKVHISIRGQGILTERGIRGIQVLLDGIPLNDPSGFAPDLYDVDWFLVERIEVIRGPAAALYGGGSSAGVINIITKNGRSDSDLGDLFFEGGSHTFRKSSGEISGRSEKMDYRFSASRAMGDGYRDHSAFSATNLYGKFRLAATPDFNLQAVFMGTGYFQENPEGLNKEQVAENPRQANPDSDSMNEYQETRRFTAGVTGNLRVTPGQNLNFTVYSRWWKYREAFPSAVQRNRISNPGAMVRYTFNTGDGPFENHFSVGADAGWQCINQKKHSNLGHAIEGAVLLSDEDVSQRGYGLFAFDRMEWRGGWGAFIAVRRDDVRNELDDNLKSGGLDLSGARSFSKNTGRLGLTWNPKPNVGLYASWGQGFMPPATEELVANPLQQGGFNNLIKPATSSGYDFGVRGKVSKTFTYDVSTFYLNTYDDFERYREPSRPMETFYGNAGKTRRYGLETTLGWFPCDEFEAHLACTWNHFKYRSYESRVFAGDLRGNRLPNSPARQAAFDMTWRPVERLSLGLGAQAQSRSYVDPTNVPYVGGYALWNARMGYGWKASGSNGEVYIAVTNALGKKYIAFTEPDPDGNSYQPGPRREIFAGVRIRFGR